MGGVRIRVCTHARLHPGRSPGCPCCMAFCAGSTPANAYIQGVGHASDAISWRCDALSSTSSIVSAPSPPPLAMMPPLCGLDDRHPVSQPVQSQPRPLSCRPHNDNVMRKARPCKSRVRTWKTSRRKGSGNCGSGLGCTKEALMKRSGVLDVCLCARCSTTART
ncbi:hypothetical protein BS78_04G181300 [Paspalum vaginatum]|nr:hypothetical protein BS78_04G181300 [Paspalum vaginatum]KAJ1279775.1 hypothetical protein BS78_04G181300 [Paspalum vaginatum]